MSKTRNEMVLGARQLRREMTLPEGLLWQILRKRPAGLKFRNQHPVGPYVLDFYCASKRLAIEVDGLAHDMGDNPKTDEQRDEYLRGRGLRVVRFPATEVLQHVNDVVNTILAEACA